VDETAPWGNRWFGKGAALGGWYNNFPIPFQKSIRVTGQLSYDGIHPTNETITRVLYLIVRGSENILPYSGSYVIPGTARVQLQKIQNLTMQPLDYVNIVDLDKTHSGLIFWSTFQVQSGTMNFLEGCYHLFTPNDNSVPYPGLILATGTEDFYDSAYYFNAGQFRQENAGFTHLVNQNGTIYWAAYKLQEVDPLFFNNGVQLVWRNGDVSDKQGHKCTSVDGTKIANPTISYVTSYAWIYTW